MYKHYCNLHTLQLLCIILLFFQPATQFAVGDDSCLGVEYGCPSIVARIDGRLKCSACKMPHCRHLKYVDALEDSPLAEEETLNRKMYPCVSKKRIPFDPAPLRGVLAMNELERFSMADNYSVIDDEIGLSTNVKTCVNLDSVKKPLKTFHCEKCFS